MRRRGKGGRRGGEYRSLLMLGRDSCAGHTRELSKISPVEGGLCSSG